MLANPFFMYINNELFLFVYFHYFSLFFIITQTMFTHKQGNADNLTTFIFSLFKGDCFSSLTLDLDLSVYRDNQISASRCERDKT